MSLEGTIQQQYAFSKQNKSLIDDDDDDDAIDTN